MSKKVIRTKEEIASYVRAYQQSGKTVSAWSRENNIPQNTVRGWLRKHTTQPEPIRLLPVKIKEDAPIKTKEVSLPELRIEARRFTVCLGEGVSVHLLQDVLKAVWQLHVSV